MWYALMIIPTSNAVLNLSSLNHNPGLQLTFSSYFSPNKRKLFFMEHEHQRTEQNDLIRIRCSHKITPTRLLHQRPVVPPRDSPFPVCADLFENTLTISSVSIAVLPW